MTTGQDVLTDGPFRRATALRAGISDRRLAAMVGSGSLVQVLRGVYLPAALLDDIPARTAAVALVLPTGAAVCRETAAWLHGIDVRPPGSHTVPPRLQCLVPESRVPLRRPGWQSFSSHLPSNDLCSVGGVPVTTPERTALDLSRWSPSFVGLAGLDAFAHAGLIDPADLMPRVDAIRGQRFTAQARRLIELCEPDAESAGESWLRLRLVDAGLPRPQVQIPFFDDAGAERYRVDAGYVEHRVGIEYDGEEFHFRTMAQIRADEYRRGDLQQRYSWTVVGATSEHVLAARPAVEQVVADMIGWTRPLLRRAW